MRKQIIILLIHPQDTLQRLDGGLYGKSLRYAAITMPTLAALVPEDLKPYIRIRIIDEMVEKVDLDFRPDLVGITSISSASKRAYMLADHYRSHGAKVVMGGVHVTLMPEEAKAHADVLILGHAEKSWPKFLRDFFENKFQEIYKADEKLTSSIYTPFPGTRAFKRLKSENRILTEDWTLYNGHNVVFQPAKMSVQELQQGLGRVWNEVYRFPNILRRLAGPPYLFKPAAFVSNLAFIRYINKMHNFYDLFYNLPTSR